MANSLHGFYFMCANKRKGVRMTGKSAFEKQFSEWMAEPDMKLPIDWPAEFVPTPIPIRFEDSHPELAKILISLFDAGKIVKINLVKKDKKGLTYR